MADGEIEEKYERLIRIKGHLDAIKDDWDDETLEELKEFMHEKYSGGNPQISSTHFSGDDESQDSKNGFFSRIWDAFDRDVGIDPGRLLGLTDGVFSIVMTLLVFGIAIPELEVYTYENFLSTFSSLLPTIGVTLVSFVIVSSFWIYHHEYVKMKNLNILYLWLNIIFLICISFIPFSTSLIGTYSEFFASEVVFGINILLSIISFLLMYLYATKKDFLENMPSKKEKDHVLLTLASIMGLTIIVNLLDFYVSSSFIYLFFLIPVLSTILDTWYHYKNS